MVEQNQRSGLLTSSFFLALSPELVSRDSYSAPGCLCPAGHCFLGFPGHGSPKLVWPVLPAPGESSGRHWRKSGLVGEALE